MLSAHLELGRRWTFVGGKGGVGKTTVAAALALELADSGVAVVAVSTDPAHSLGDALGVRLGHDPAPVPGASNLSAAEVDADAERLRFLEANRDAIAALLERGTYLDAADVREITGLAVPGMDELAAILGLARLAADPDRRVIVDTAPTGHTLRLLDLPGAALGWLGALEAMEAKHAAVASALAGQYAGDEATAFLAGLRDDLAELTRLLRDPRETRFILVTTAEPVVVRESLRYQESLAERGIATGGMVVNRLAGRPPEGVKGLHVLFAPRLPRDPSGLEGLRRFSRAATADAPAGGGVMEGGERDGVALGPVFELPADRALYLVGGKGGVGKSTASAALALRLAEVGSAPVRLLSVDPAGSLGEVLGRPVAGAEVPIAPGLTAGQLDAARAWDAFRDRYREEVESLFGGLLGGGSSALYDRQVVARLVDLAPPGIDELMALMEVLDLTEDAPGDVLVLDTAPTGHLLRLLEMPDLALSWCHTLLRLLLKYREAVPLGGVAEDVLALSRNVRALGARLRREGSWILVVALPEALSVPETRRLVRRLRELEMTPSALLVNRLFEPDGGVAAGRAEIAAELGRLAEGMPLLGAPALEAGPAGIGPLRDFLARWRVVERSDPGPGHDG